MRTALEIALEKTKDIPPAPSEEERRKAYEEETKTCLNCQWLRQEDEGYSEWTVLGYQADCMFGLNSFNSEHRNHDDKNLVGKDCEFFTRGSRLEICMGEGEKEASIRDWIKLLGKT